MPFTYKMHVNDSKFDRNFLLTNQIALFWLAIVYEINAVNMLKAI